MLAVYLGIGLTGWVSLCRVVRAETMRLRDEKYPDRRRNDRSDDSHFDRSFCREDRPEQHIPPQIVRSERMLPGWRLKTFRVVLHLIDRLNLFRFTISGINFRKDCGAEVEQAEDQRRQCELFRAKPTWITPQSRGCAMNRA